MAPAIAMLIAAGLSAATSAVSSSVASNKQKRYERELKKAQEEAEKEAELEQRRQAIAKAISKNKLDPYGFLGKPIQQRTVDKPNFTSDAVFNAVGQGASSLLSNWASNQQAKQSQDIIKPRRFDVNKYYSFGEAI